MDRRGIWSWSRYNSSSKEQAPSIVSQGVTPQGTATGRLSLIQNNPSSFENNNPPRSSNKGQEKYTTGNNNYLQHNTVQEPTMILASPEEFDLGDLPPAESYTHNGSQHHLPSNLNFLFSQTERQNSIQDNISQDLPYALASPDDFALADLSPVNSEFNRYTPISHKQPKDSYNNQSTSFQDKTPEPSTFEANFYEYSSLRLTLGQKSSSVFSEPEYQSGEFSPLQLNPCQQSFPVSSELGQQSVEPFSPQHNPHQEPFLSISALEQLQNQYSNQELENAWKKIDLEVVACPLKSSGADDGGSMIAEYGSLISTQDPFSLNQVRTNKQESFLREDGSQKSAQSSFYPHQGSVDDQESLPTEEALKPELNLYHYHYEGRANASPMVHTLCGFLKYFTSNVFIDMEVPKDVFIYLREDENGLLPLDNIEGETNKAFSGITTFIDPAYFSQVPCRILYGKMNFSTHCYPRHLKNIGMDKYFIKVTAWLKNRRGGALKLHGEKLKIYIRLSWYATQMIMENKTHCRAAAAVFQEVILASFNKFGERTGIGKLDHRFYGPIMIEISFGKPLKPPTGD